MELVYWKNDSNLLNTFVLKLSKMVATQTDCSMLEQRSVIKFLVVEECNLCENYGRICDIYVETCFRKKCSQTDWTWVFQERGWVENIIYEVETHWFSSKKVSDASISKGNPAGSLLEHERIHHQCFLWPSPQTKFNLFIEWPLFVCWLSGLILSLT